MNILLFKKIKSPIILKEGSSTENEIAQYKSMLETASSREKSFINDNINILEAGLLGERRVLFELKNSHIPMLILQDLYLEHDSLSAQIDFLVITRLCNFIIECKNLVGDIEITETGAFIRNAYGKKEGIYSPVTQNKRHLELIREIRKETKPNALMKHYYDKWFYDVNKSIIVLAKSS